MALPVVYAGNPTSIPEFYQKLVTHLQSLEAIEKRNSNERYMKNMLEKFWRNPVTEPGKDRPPFQKKKKKNPKNFKTRQQNVTN